MTRCPFLLECERFDRLFTLVRRRTLGFSLRDDTMVDAAAEYLQGYCCNEDGYRLCEEFVRKNN